MKICILRSGSKANCTVIIDKDTIILIDIGIKYNELISELNNLNINPNNITACLITHSHTDHIGGLNIFLKHHKIPIFLSKDMITESIYLRMIESYILYEDNFNINDINITVFPTSHDKPSVGFIIKNKSKELVYVTDTGYIHDKYMNLLHNKDIYIIESNHDIEMLQNGKYPEKVKRRILSDNGHLSNNTTSYYLSKHLIGNNTKIIVLAHLSEENNTPKKALDTLKSCLGNNKINILTANPHEKTEIIEV